MAYKCVAWQETRYGTGGDQPPVMVLTPTAPSLAASPSGSERGLRARIVHRAQKGGRPRDVPLACSGTPCKHGREHPGLPPLSRGGEQRGQEKTNASSWAGGTGEVRGGRGEHAPLPTLPLPHSPCHLARGIFARAALFHPSAGRSIPFAITTLGPMHTARKDHQGGYVCSHWVYLYNKGSSPEGRPVRG